MDCLVFDTEIAAQTAADTIYANMVAAINSPDLLNVDTGQVVEKDSLTPEQAVEQNAQNRFYPIFGINLASNQKNATDGYTTAWAVPQLTVQGKWAFAKPDDALMTSVVDYTVEPFDPNWFEHKESL